MEASYQVFSKLEERLEQTRKQKSKLGHELGLGRPCLVCNEKCVGGLNLHFWRKICVNCKCPKEKHDLQPEDYGELDQVFEVLGVKIPEHKNLYKYSLKNQKTPSSTQAQQVDWVPLITEADDAKRNQKIDKYFEDLGENSIPFKNSEAALRRKEQAQIQIPPHDFNPDKCDNLSEFETQQLQKYVESVKKNNLGQGQIDVIEPPAPSLSAITSGNRAGLSATTTNPFGRPPSHDAMLNTINNNNNNNNLAVNDLMNNLTLNEETKCRRCDLQITSSYVKAERLNAQYHPKCFTCKKCSQLLVDLIYFHYKNEIYCARDLAELMAIPRCAACDELILVAEFTLADGNNYHIKHFCCVFCDNPLAGFQYVNDEKTNNPVCLPCYDKHFASLCTMCNNIIAPSEQGVSFKDFHFHLKCFNCGCCSKELIGSRFCMRNNIPFCSSNCVNKAGF